MRVNLVHIVDEAVRPSLTRDVKEGNGKSGGMEVVVW